ncbi:MAG: M12 family metallo-peptidase [Ketobacteraceae bacterium]|nr:M12 family metallo-peptidase [Ketobacteraceae bacterium]
MGFFRIFSLLFILVLSWPARAANLELPVWIDEQVYTLELEPHSIAGLKLTGNAQLFRGQIAGIPDSWARMSQLNARWEGVVSLHGVLHVIDFSAPTDSTRSDNTRVLQSSVITATPASAYDNLGTCALHDHQSSPFATASRSMLDPGTPTAAAASFSELCTSTVDGVCLLAEIDFVFDQAFQSDFPSDYQSRAAQLINIVEGYYRNDLDIAFKTLTTTFLSSEVFSTTTDSFNLLRDISNKKGNGELTFSSKNEALMQVITGRDFDGDTVGIAWVGGLCDNGGYFSTGTTQIVGGSLSLTALVAAHEIGHNLGSDHDGDPNNSCTGGFIMATRLDATASRFSSCSISAIQSAIGSASNQNACFDYPFDVEIADSNSVSNLITSTASRTFRINASAASQAITQASISGTINSGAGRFTSVTIDDIPCSIAGDGQNYSCTLSAPGNNHVLVADISVATGSYQVSHNVNVSQSELTETDTTNNSISDNFTVLTGDSSDSGGGGDSTETEDPASSEDTASGNADSNSASDSGGGSGGGGGSMSALLLMSLALLLYRRQTAGTLTCRL